MAWNCNLRVLPHVFSYTQAQDVWDRAPEAKTGGQLANGWSHERRPLDDFRKTHYAVERVWRNDRQEFDFYLYKTRVVCWRGLSTVTIQAKWISAATSDFLYQFTGFVRVVSRSHYSDGHKRVVLVGDKEFVPDELTFEKRGDIWECTHSHDIPMRKVLHPDSMAYVLKSLRPYTEWIKSVYAMLPPETPFKHPWVGMADVPAVPLSRLAEGDMEAFVSTTIRFSRKQVYRSISGLANTASDTNLKELLESVRRHYYEATNAYIEIPYNQPIPGRSK